MSIDRLPSPETANEHIFHTLSLFVGRGRRFSVDDIEVGTRIPARTVSAWISSDPESRRKPKADHMLILMAFLGNEFAAKILAHAGLGTHDLDADAKLAPTALIAELSIHLGTLAKCAVDNRFDHVEEPETRTAADGMILAALPYSSFCKDRLR